MATTTIRNIPDDPYDALKWAAARHRRGLDQQVIVQLEAGLNDEPLNVENLLSEVRRVREQLTGGWLTDELLDELVNEGRP
ncbi:MAG: DNA-binding protein [Gemmatimonadota bacterium]|nr:DNA-binding protein [Gemmatimonadota bacterium]